jgi:hypothetical protein
MRKGRLFTFQLDEWDWLLHRRGHALSVFLTPHAEHLSALPILAYKASFQLFGASSTFPLRLLDALVAATTAILVYVLTARRLGKWVALAPAAILLFFGPGWSDIMWAFQIGYMGSLAAGCGALLLLERADRRGDIGAAILLIVSLASSSVGVMMLIGVIAELLLRYRTERFSRLWIAIIPAALYLLWYSQYGVSTIQLGRLDTVPLWVFDGLAGTAGAITGLTQPADSPYAVTIDPGTTLAALLLVAVGSRLFLGRPLSPRFWAVAIAAVAFLAADTLSYGPGRGADASRYTYPLAVFMLLAIVEMCSRWRPTRRALLALGVASLAAIVSNLGFLTAGEDQFAVDSAYAKAELGAMQVARNQVAPSFSPAEPALAAIVGDHNMGPIDAKSYFSAIDAFGSPADTPAQILRAPENAREAADLVIANAERLALRPASLPTTGCSKLRPAGGGIELTVGAGTLVMRPAQTVQKIELRRFAVNYMFEALGPVTRGATVALMFPPDRSTFAWYVRVVSSGPVVVCGAS